VGIEDFLSSGNVRMDQQLKFTAEIDKMTGIIRRTSLIDKSRRENDAEHSWHIATMAMLFEEYASEPVNVPRAVEMCVVHDLIEIYAGDTFAYDVAANIGKADREKAAADELFKLLPEEQGAMIRSLWEEFDAMETPDSKYAACMDRLQPFLHNTLTDGFTWVESGTNRAVVEKRMAVIKEFMPEVYKWVEENMNRAIAMGWLKESRKILLFDLDGTLLRSDKTISEKTLKAVLKAKAKGYLIGVSTSRSENNSLSFIDSISPDIIISSGGAMVNAYGRKIVLEGFSGDETADIIAKAREVIGNLNITVDTAEEDAEYYRNFVPPQDELEKSWGISIETDFRNFRKPSLKICFEIDNEEKAESLHKELPECDFIHFTDGDWYKVTKAGITKETAIEKLAAHLGVGLDMITAFGDDLADIGSLKMCGTGVAMGNALPEVKEAADIIIGSNDEDGIAEYLENCYED
jgi:HAD-superfamily hydrolase, subfamily IIB